MCVFRSEIDGKAVCVFVYPCVCLRLSNLNLSVCLSFFLSKLVPSAKTTPKRFWIAKLQFASYGLNDIFTTATAVQNWNILNKEFAPNHKKPWRHHYYSRHSTQGAFNWTGKPPSIFKIDSVNWYLKQYFDSHTVTIGVISIDMELESN